MKNKSVALVILDGWGFREDPKDNAIFEAHTPFFDSLWQKYPHALLDASGKAVGLPEGQMGNSEVGHMTIGAGKVIDTDLVKISKAAKNNEFILNPAFTVLFNHVKKNNSVLHIQGIIGPGGVHGHSEHLYEFLKTAQKAGVEKIAIHIFTDGRDTPPQSSANFIKELEKVIQDLGIGFIATASGRFYAMDRDNNWNRIAKVEDALFKGKARKTQSLKASEYLENLYREGQLDEHLEPTIFLDENGKNYQIKENDGILYFNFRADRARQLSKKIAILAKEKNLCFVTMTEYDKEIDSLVAFPPSEIESTLAGEISKAGLSQVHIAETEKFAHATYYLNCGKNKPHDKEIQKLIESRKDIDTHDKAPEMRATEIADTAIKYIDAETDFIFVNFANPDMVGHTGNKAALSTAINHVDCELKKIIEHIIKKGGIAIITADHGNAEINITEKGEPHTAHTTSPVPIILVSENKKIKNGGLADLAPTILALLDLKVPSSMTGKNLIN